MQLGGFEGVIVPAGVIVGVDAAFGLRKGGRAPSGREFVIRLRRDPTGWNVPCGSTLNERATELAARVAGTRFCERSGLHQADDAHRGGAIDVCAIAELPRFVEPPAAYFPAVEQDARVSAARSYPAGDSR